MQTLQIEVESGCQTGNLFGEMIGNSLLVYISEHYSTDPPKSVPTRGGLPGSRLNPVLEYIHSNLDRDIRLGELAETAGLSAFHFAKLFKQSAGTARISTYCSGALSEPKSCCESVP